jgi:hypothetical protein
VPFLEMLRLDEANQGAIEAKQLTKLEADLSFEQSRENLLAQTVTTEIEINRHLPL